jgi:hypothetical protein
MPRTLKLDVKLLLFLPCLPFLFVFDYLDNSGILYIELYAVVTRFI